MTYTDTIAIDPQPFGPPTGKPATAVACRVTSVRSYPSFNGPAGFDTILTVCTETPAGDFAKCQSMSGARVF